jgi:hypothetical protein
MRAKEFRDVGLPRPGVSGILDMPRREIIDGQDQVVPGERYLPIPKGQRFLPARGAREIGRCDHRKEEQGVIDRARQALSPFLAPPDILSILEDPELAVTRKETDASLQPFAETCDPSILMLVIVMNVAPEASDVPLCHIEYQPPLSASVFATAKT